MGTPFKIRLNKYQVLIGLVLLGFMFWGARSLWDSSDARCGQAAFERFASGNCLVPTLAGKTDAAGVNNSRQVLPITKSHRLAALERNTAHPAEKAGTEKYAVPANALPESVKRRARKRVMTRRERMATLLLILARSHH